MLQKLICTFVAVFFLSTVYFAAAAADDMAPSCVRLDAKASGDLQKFSLDGDANGPVFFSGISCAIEHRNRELCAMEMISFDITAKVYDYYTAEPIEIGKAYFWLDEKDSNVPILAFGSKETAAKYEAEKRSGVVLDYSALTERPLK